MASRRRYDNYTNNNALSNTQNIGSNPSRFSFDSTKKITGSGHHGATTTTTTTKTTTVSSNFARATTTERFSKREPASAAVEGHSFADSLAGRIDLSRDQDQEQSDVNFSESDFQNLPSSPPPPPRFTTKPLFRSRHAYSGSMGSLASTDQQQQYHNNNHQLYQHNSTTATTSAAATTNGHWQGESSSDASISPVQKHSRLTNLSRDRQILKKLSSNPYPIHNYDPSSPTRMSGVALHSEFDTDGMSANTTKLEHAMVRAAERDVDGLNSRFQRLRATSSGAAAASIPMMGSTSEDSSESRRSRISLLNTLTSRKEPVAKPNAATRHSFDESSVSRNQDFPGITRSVSSGSSDGRRRRDIMAKGFESPSRRRRLLNLLRGERGSQDSETPRATAAAAAAPPRYQVPIRPVSASGSYTSSIVDPQLEDSKHSSTIDWLAAASPEGVLESKPFKEGKAPIASSTTTPSVRTTNRPFIQKTAPTPTSLNTLDNTPKPYQISSVSRTTYTKGNDSIISSISATPKPLPPKQIPSKSQSRPQASALATTTFKIEEDAIDLLRRFSRAASASPSSSTTHSSRDRYDDKTPRPRTKVKAEPIAETSFVEETPKQKLSQQQQLQEQQQPASAQSKRFPLATPGSAKRSKTDVDGQTPHSVVSTSNRSARDIFTAPKSSNSKAPLSHLGTQSTPKSTRSHASHRSMVLRSPALSDYDDLVGFNSSPLSAKHERSVSHSRIERKSSPSPIPTPERLSSRPKIPVIVPKPAEEEYHTDDSLDRLLANDTDYSSLIRPARFEDESFLESAVALNSNPNISPDKLQRELAEHARLVNKLQVLRLEIRDARKGIEVIEKRMTHEDGNSSGFFDDSMMITEDDEEKLKRGKISRRPTECQKPRPREAFSFWEKFMCFLGVLVLLILIEFKLWSDTIIPEYSEESSDEWWAKHPPVDYQFGTSFRYYWSLILPALKVLWVILGHCWTVLVWVFAGVQWVETRVMDGIMPPPLDIADTFTSISSSSSLSTTPLSSSAAATISSPVVHTFDDDITTTIEKISAETEVPMGDYYTRDNVDSDDVPGYYDSKGNWVPDRSWDA